MAISLEVPPTELPMAKNGNTNSVPLGIESQLWAAADALRNNMDAAEYKHVVLGLIFLKYISDAFDERHAALLTEVDQGADPEDPDEYRAANIFWVPAEARWSHLRANAKQPTIGKLIDGATIGIGAGPHTDGQVLVFFDMLGYSPDFSPKFLKRYMGFDEQALKALKQYKAEVENGQFPAKDNSY